MGPSTGWSHVQAGSRLNDDQNAFVFAAVAPMHVSHNLGLFLFQIWCSTSEASKTGTSIGTTLPWLESQVSTVIIWVASSQSYRKGMARWKSLSVFCWCRPQQANEASVLIVGISNPSLSAAWEYLCIALTCSSLEVHNSIGQWMLDPKVLKPATKHNRNVAMVRV